MGQEANHFGTRPFPARVQPLMRRIHAGPGQAARESRGETHGRGHIFCNRRTVPSPHATLDEIVTFCNMPIPRNKQKKNKKAKDKAAMTEERKKELAAEVLHFHPPSLLCAYRTISTNVVSRRRRRVTPPSGRVTMRKQYITSPRCCHITSPHSLSQTTVPHMFTQTTDVVGGFSPVIQQLQ